MKIKNYNIEIDGRNFYDQAVNDTIKQYDEVRKIWFAKILKFAKGTTKVL